MKKMFELPTPSGTILTRNGKKEGKAGGMRCIRCDLPVDPTKAIWFRFHHGGLYVVTQEEGDRLNAAGKEGSDLGCHPLGPECAKKVPKEFWLDEESQTILRKMNVNA